MARGESRHGPHLYAALVSTAREMEEGNNAMLLLTPGDRWPVAIPLENSLSLSLIGLQSESGTETKRACIRSHRFANQRFAGFADPTERYSARRWSLLRDVPVPMGASPASMTTAALATIL